MKDFKKKILSLVLVIAMMVTILPTPIFATILQNSRMNTIVSEESNNDASQENEKEESNKVETEPQNKVPEDEKDPIKNENQNKDENQDNEKIDWPEKPNWVGKKPQSSVLLNLESGQNQSEFYANPHDGVSQDDIDKAKEESKDIELKDSKEISADKFNLKLEVFINGKKYEGGDVTVKEGENFSYRLDWGPIKDDVQLDTGSYFTKDLFTVKGLKFPNEVKKKLVINGINVGEMLLTYDSTTGKMNYKVTFTKYINLFDKNSVFAYFQGSSSFSFINGESIEIDIWGTKGNMIIQQVEKPVTPPSIPNGNGWEAPRAPSYGNKIISFKKGVKWSNHENTGNKDPQIEWRVIFLERLQRAQREFLEKNPIETKESILGKIDIIIENIKLKVDDAINDIKSNNEVRTVTEKGYCIVEDTLDENQVFYRGELNENDKKKYGNAPFFIELPVVLIGTDHILNRKDGPMDGAGDSNGDGAGDIEPYISGDKFKEITEGNNDSKRKTVESTPMTYAILKDNKTKKETLIINCGKLGETGEGNLAWPDNKWTKDELEKSIEWCKSKIEQITAGQNSPISNLKTKYTELDNVLNKIMNTSQVEENQKKKIEEFKEDYKKKVTDTSLKNDAQITNDQIPSMDKLIELEEIPIDANGKKLKNNGHYQNYKKSLQNVVNDQKIFLENRNKYVAEWEVLKSRYERTLKFYSENKGIEGFVLKIRSKVIKNSETGFSNTVSLTDSEKKYTSNKEHKVKFEGGIIGNFSLGSVVLKKADSSYGTGNSLGELNKANGLSGAKFNIYSAADGENFEKNDKNIDYFLEKEASENGDAYTYTHTGNETSGNMVGKEKDLIVNDDGTLVLNGLTGTHYAVEKEAPKGYYLDETPVEIKADADTITYKLVPNVQRSIGIRKIDSYSKKAIGGVEFELYKGNEKITNFKKETVNGHTGYYISDKGTDKLITSDEEIGKDDKTPNLCIHGLDAGTYKLKEVAAADGYEAPDQTKEYTFTLHEKIDTTKLDKLNHVVKDDTGKDAVIENKSKVDKLLFTKIDGNPPNANNSKSENIIEKVINKIKGENKPNYDNHEKLAGAYFSVFKFKGNDSEWENKDIRENTNNWEMIRFGEEQNKNYFTTGQEINDNFIDSTRPGDTFKNVSAIKTDENGNISIENIPKGYYILAEVKAPEGYVINLNPFYFKSGDCYANGSLKLYRNVGSEGQLENEFLYNKILNFKRKLKLKLVKYDSDKEKPTIDGDVLVDYGNIKEGDIAYKYNSNVNNPGGIAGVTYKLFLNEGSEMNPNPEEIKPENSETIIGGSNGNYDICIARGVTDDKGILDITEMLDKEGKKSFKDGVRMGKYYLIEVATSKEYDEGYILDQKPIQFNLDKGLFDIFPDVDDTGIGLLKTASNTKGDSGIKIIKNNEEKEKLKGAEFVVKDSEGNYLYPEKIEEKENQYTLNKKSSSSNSPQEKVSTDFDTPSKDNPSKVENYNKIPNELKIKTGKNGELILRGLIAGQEYQFVEVKAPVGYKIPENNTFKATAPKTREDKGAQKLEGDNLIYVTEEIENIKLKGNLKLSKIDSNTREELEGAVFSIYKEVHNEGTEDNNPPENPNGETPENPNANKVYKLYKEGLKTDANGVLEVKDLDWGDYYIQETKAPDGYVLDESRYHFTINERSFNENGNSINITIPYIENAPKGARRIKIVKTSENGERLEGVKFKLEKRKKLLDGTIKWIPYGKEEYVTNKNGEIDLVLPIGFYKLVEIGTVDGHILDTNEILFEIEKNDNIDMEIETIEVVNIKAATALHLKKTIEYNGENTEKPVEGVKFSFYDNETGDNPLKFKKIKKGVYKYADNQNEEGLTTELETNRHGEIRVALNNEFIGANPKNLYYKEVKVPGNIEIDPTMHKADIFKENEWQNQKITNKITPENRNIKIEVDKRNEENQPVEGAEFTLFDSKFKKLASKYTKMDKDGQALAIFTDEDLKEHGGFKIGKVYYIVETKAPEGYIIDPSIRKIELTNDIFEQDKDGNLIIEPISFIAVNTKHAGSFILEKVDSKDENIKLKDVEFEIFKKVPTINVGEGNDVEKPEQNDSGNENPIVRMINKVKDILNIGDKTLNNESTPETKPDEWLRYGDGIYKTNEDGKIIINNMPVGEYYYIEKRAPFGYETGSIKKGSFKIEPNGNGPIIVNLKVENEKIPGKMGKVTLLKSDSISNEVLDGAGFKLFYKDESEEKYNLVNDTTYTTDENGKLAIDNLPPGEYYLLETVAPEGYELPTDFAKRKHYFTIERDSKLAQNILLNVTNDKQGSLLEKGSVVLEKVDKDTQNKLKGAEFKLYYEHKNEQGKLEYIPYNEEVFVTGEDGRIIINNLPIGKYYFEEVKAPEGYVLSDKEDDRKHYFSVNGNEEENIVIKVENSKNGGGGGTITPNPDPEKPEKPDPEKPNPDPEKPEKPDPEKPDKPDSGKPDKPDSGNNGGSSIIDRIPKTGDAASLGLASIVFVGAGTGLYAIRKKNQIPMKRNSRRRRNRKRK